MEWEILMTSQVEEFLDVLHEVDRETHRLVNQAILVLERSGPSEGRPLVDSIAASRITNMKELRPPSVGRSEIRILFVFDSWRSAILLIAGDKSGQWSRWYREAIPEAEQLYDTYLKEREKEIGDERR
ncbi:type II toxin-antitoxin system RelE/ParE family toxin [Dactylosporangium sp. NPDC000521]|uniref:type II toxin-antitoxin system RelE/ParE family toxin n=1 Tax=Dactylosporangium sp. NPDC000521 TaxID=3363975 RepID=UPI003678BD86